MGDPDVVYLNPAHVLWMSLPTAAHRRPGGTAIRVDDRVKGGALLLADDPPAAQLLQDLGPFVTVTLANPSSDYPNGVVHVRAHARLGPCPGRLGFQGRRLRRRCRAMAGDGRGGLPLTDDGAAARRAATIRQFFPSGKP
ncbi:hypothetical protein DF048_08920 [Burkholderia seminalis]|nr:hypothetical protein DF048_08920 [Burkholderia seminalis]